MKFTSYSTGNGLLQSKVYTILQDEKGFMWFGTQEGLSRFDGYTMKTFRHDPENEHSPGGLSIFTSMKDSLGNLWFGSERGRFFKYVPERDLFLNFAICGKEDSQNIYISSFSEDDSGNIFVSSYGGGVNRFESGLFLEAAEDMQQSRIAPGLRDVSVICMNSSGDMLIGTDSEGLYVIDHDKINSGNCTEHPVQISGLTGNHIRSLHCDTRNRILAGTTTGLNILLPDGQIEKYTADGDPGCLSYNVVTAIAEDRDRRIWVATRNGGVNLLDERHSKFVSYMYELNDPDSISDNSIHSLYLDRTNVLWIGTVSSGVCKTDLDSKPFHSLSEMNTGFRHVKNVNCILKDSRSVLYAGTLNRGLAVAESGNRSLKIYHKKQLEPELFFPGNSIYALCETGDSKIWVGASNSGLLKFDRQGSRFISFMHDDIRLRNVFAVAKDGTDDRKLFVGTDQGGFYVFDSETESFMDSELTGIVGSAVSGSLIRSIYSDAQGSVWLAASNTGLMKITSDRKRVIGLAEIDERFSGYIRHIAPYGESKILVCTALHGLIVLDSASAIICTYTEQDGIAGNSTMSAAVDKQGNIWVCTTNGLSRIDTEKGKITSYYESDNLVNREFNEGAIFEDTHGTIYAGSAGGANYFFPTEILDNPHRPVTAITDFQIFNNTVKAAEGSKILEKPLPYADRINLSYRHSVFSFEFTALVYNDPDKNQYAYMLEGFDKEWNYCGTRRFATYTNIGPGNYTFKVKGSNNDGVWSADVTELNLRIDPPFWDTWWFKSAGALAAFAAAGALYKGKMKRIQKENELNDEFSRKLLDSQESERKRIASELHDTIAHDILIMKNKAYLGIAKEQDPEKLKAVLKEISDLSSDAISDVRTISYNLHPHKIESLGLTKALSSMLSLAEQSSGIKFDVNFDNIDSMFGKDLELNIFRIIQELTNNIIKHSNARNVVAEISKGNSNIYVNITDDGDGIKNFEEVENGNTGLGLIGIKTRLRLYDGTFEIKSPEFGGTSVKIIIPYKRKLQ